VANAQAIDVRTTAIRLGFWAAFAVLCAVVGAGIVLAINGHPPVPPPSRPYAKINGPSSAPAGKQIEITADGSLATTLLWEVPDYEDSPTGNQILGAAGESSANWVRWPEGNKIVGAFIGSGKQKVTLVAIDPDGKGGQTIATDVLTVDVSGPGPGPNPNPNPPTPPIPDGAHGLSRAAYLAAQQIPAAQRAREASLLAAVFESVASQVAAGAFTINELSVKTKAATDAALGASTAIWSNAFASVDALVAQLDQSKALIEPADFAAAWREIAAGLRAVT
jgi:hypothetical protein